MKNKFVLIKLIFSEHFCLNLFFTICLKIFQFFPFCIGENSPRFPFDLSSVFVYMMPTNCPVAALEWTRAVLVAPAWHFLVALLTAKRENRNSRCCESCTPLCKQPLKRNRKWPLDRQCLSLRKIQLKSFGFTEIDIGCVWSKHRFWIVWIWSYTIASNKQWKQEILCKLK